MKILSKIALGTLLVLGHVVDSSADITPNSTTYYISPHGNDANMGTAKRAPWQSWPRALQALSPGDTLIVMPGTWKDGVCGLTDQNCLGQTALPNIDCSQSNIADGTSGLPITIKTTAADERKSLLHSNLGDYALKMDHCSYYNIEGLWGKSADKASAGTNHSVFVISNSDNIYLKRLLLQENNRYRNTHLLGITDSNHVTVEASEFYDFHRHGISISSNSEYITTKRNYLHARMRADLPNGRESHTPDMGDECITFYTSDNNVSENDIGFNCEGIQSTGKSNQILGGIVMDGKFGFAISSNCRDTGTAQLCSDNVDLYAAANNLVKDSVSINNATGAECKSARGCSFTNMTVVNSEHWGFAMRDDIGTSSGQGRLAGRFNPTVDISRSIALQSERIKNNNGVVGFYIADLDEDLCDDLDYIQWNLECEADKVENISNGETLWYGSNLLAWNFKAGTPIAGYSNSGDEGMVYGQWENRHSADPKMNGCYLDLNEKSSPVAVLFPGAEMGANALYLYENAVRTGNPAFDIATNQFVGCGAVVEGVNDGVEGCAALAQNPVFNIQSCGYYDQ